VPGRTAGPGTKALAQATQANKGSDLHKQDESGLALELHLGSDMSKAIGARQQEQGNRSKATGARQQEQGNTSYACDGPCLYGMDAEAFPEVLST
jgi:hypothetical protein